MKTIRTIIRKFIWKYFHERLQYHSYKAGNVAGFSGYYTLFGFVITFEDSDTRNPYFTW